MTHEELQLLFQEELARLHLVAELLVVSLSEPDQWLVSLRLRGREFEVGSAFHGGFFCCQATPRGKVNFVPAGTPPLFGQPGLLVRSGLLMIVAGMHDPETVAAGPAVI